MNYGTKEFYEAIDHFEKCAKNTEGGFYCASFERCDKETSKEYSNMGNLQVYNNGETNKLFQVFLCGIGYGKLIERPG